MKIAKRIWLAGALLTGALTAAGQTGELRLRVTDAATQEAVAGAVAELSSDNVSFRPRHEFTDPEGRCVFLRLPREACRLHIYSLGYDTLRMELPPFGRLVLDTLTLRPRAEEIAEIRIEAQALRSSVRGDTLSYRADAFRVAFGSDAEALLAKMPGLKVSEEGIEAQGRTIQRVYVDGREFFGNDLLSAIRNIPSDIIESIDVFSSRSDMAEMTGVDTGDGPMALNIVTRPDKRRGAFGKLFGGYGLRDKYIGGGNVNLFDNERRLTVVGLANNLSRQNFAFEDLLGSAEETNVRSSDKNFMVKPLDGLSTVQAVGVNYSDAWAGKGKIAASYFFNRTRNRNSAASERQSFTSSDRMQLNDDRTDSRILNRNHRFNTRFDYRFSPVHSLMLRASFSAQDNDLSSEMVGLTENAMPDGERKFLYRRRNFSRSDSRGSNLAGSLLYRLNLPGERRHSLTFGVGGTRRTYRQESDPRQYTFRDPDDWLCDTLDYTSRSLTRTERTQPGYSLNGTVGYTRYLSRRSRMSIEYRYDDQHYTVERDTRLFDDDLGLFPPERNPRQSADYGYNYRSHRLGLTYQYYLRKTKIAATLQYRHTDFAGDYRFPYASRTGSAFENVTYNVVANVTIDRNNTLKFDANGRTNNPRATDLQAIVNTTNRHNLFAGNPGLKPVYTHRISGQYIRTNPVKGRTFTVAAEFQASPNSIVDSLVIDTPHFVFDDQGSELGEGNRYLKPINLPGFRSLRGNIDYGLPIRWLRSNLNLFATVSTARMPSIINGERNRLDNDVFDLGLVLGSNLSEAIDFRLSYTGSYNRSENSSAIRSFDNTYFSQRARAETTFTIRRRVVLRAAADYNHYKGITDPFREERLICNASAGLRFGRERLGEVSVGVNDLLDRSRTLFRRMVTGTSLRNVTNLGMGRYVLIQLSYNLRVFRRQSEAAQRAMESADE